VKGGSEQYSVRSWVVGRQTGSYARPRIRESATFSIPNHSSSAFEGIDPRLTEVTSRCDPGHTGALRLAVACTVRSLCRWCRRGAACRAGPERIVGKAIGNRATRLPARVQLPRLRLSSWRNSSTGSAVRSFGATAVSPMRARGGSSCRRPCCCRLLCCWAAL
jgi:hypothetical protein